MAATVARQPRTDFGQDRPTKKQTRNDIWTSLLKQTRIAQARNRANAIAHRQLVVCGGSSEDQRSFLETLTRAPPIQSRTRARNEGNHTDRGTLALSNRYSYGYGHFSLFSAQQTGIAALSTESEEVARLECHCIPEPDITYEPVLRHIFTKSEETSGDMDDDDDDEEEEAHNEEQHAPVVTILLSWKEPWRFLTKVRAWLQLLAKSLSPAATSFREDDPFETLKEHKFRLSVVVQHVEAQQELEREGWTEETFDYVCQILRTIIFPLSPGSSLLYIASSTAPQQSATQLTEVQKVIYTSLDLNMTSLSPRPSSSGNGSGAPVNKEELLPRHNIVDRMNIVIPGGGWDTIGKIRHFAESFEPDDVLNGWSYDMNDSIFKTLQQPVESAPTPAARNEDVFETDTSELEASPIPSPSKSSPSAIRAYETRIVDPNAHKVEKPPSITVTTRAEQDFLKDMKVQLDRFAVEDREKNGGPATPTTSVGRLVGVPSGDSTGALDGLGDVSFNVGGVSYNTVSAEAAIERLKRPQHPGVHDLSSPGGGSRTGTPRPPRRLESEGASTPGSSRQSAFPAEDLEKYFASLAKGVTGASSRQATPSRE